MQNLKENAEKYHENDRCSNVKKHCFYCGQRGVASWVGRFSIDANAMHNKGKNHADEKRRKSRIFAIGDACGYGSANKRHVKHADEKARGVSYCFVGFRCHKVESKAPAGRGGLRVNNFFANLAA